MAAFCGPLGTQFCGGNACVLPSMKTGSNSGRKLGDSCVARNTFRWLVVGCAAIGAISAEVEFAGAQPPQGNFGGQQNGPQGGPQNGPPQTYQRQANDWSRRGRDRRRNDFQQGFPFNTPQVNSGWYQRPYPTHLDYFRLRSNEAPPPYYGNWNGSAGGWAGPVGVWDNDAGGYVNPSSDDGTNSNQGVSPRALLMNPPSGQNKSGDVNGKGTTSPATGSDESLPAPSK